MESEFSLVITTKKDLKYNDAWYKDCVEERVWSRRYHLIKGLLHDVADMNVTEEEIPTIIKLCESQFKKSNYMIKNSILSLMQLMCHLYGEQFVKLSGGPKGYLLSKLGSKLYEQKNQNKTIHYRIVHYLIFDILSTKESLSFLINSIDQSKRSKNQELALEILLGYLVSNDISYDEMKPLLIENEIVDSKYSKHMNFLLGFQDHKRAKAKDRIHAIILHILDTYTEELKNEKSFIVKEIVK